MSPQNNKPKKLKTYIVTCNNADWNDLFTTEAANQEEAINNVWEDKFSNQSTPLGYIPYCKHDLTAISLKQLYKENGDELNVARVVTLH